MRPTRDDSVVRLNEPKGWCFTPEGAAVFEPEATAVVADVHLGYEWARARGGDVVPAHSLGETTFRLARLFDRARIRRLIVAGDLTESPHPCLRTARDLNALNAFLADRGVELIRVRGNHDGPAGPPAPATIELAGWTIAHGDRPFRSERKVIGHHHPSLRIGPVSAPCFLVGPKAIVLPAFSPNAAGAHVLSRALPLNLRSAEMRCLAASGQALLDFGRLGDLARALSAVS